MRRVAALASLALTLLPGAAVAARVNVSLRVDPSQLRGADAGGRVLLYTPKPFESGSSVSHFDRSARPDLLMEPGFSPDLPFGEVDLTRASMEDLGWRRGDFQANITYSDAPGQGFDDADLGAARRNAFEFAVGRWERLLGSSVAVDLEARFRDFECSEGRGTLAAAGPNFAFLDTPGAPPGVWHPGPLAESLASQDLSAANGSSADVSVFFNRGIDEGCLGDGIRFYYGTDDGRAPNEVSFVNVTLHELAHALGFTVLADGETGELFRQQPDAFSRRIFDNRIGESWDELTDAQRRRSAKRPGEVVFDGDNTTAAADGLLDAADVLRIHRPKNLRQDYDVATALFGPPLTARGVRGDLVLVDDGSARPTLGCEPLANAGAMRGKVALIDRGDCLFTTKVKNAQDAGAIAAVIIHDEGGPPPRLGGEDSSIVIPSVRVGQKDGRRLKRRVR